MSKRREKQAARREAAPVEAQSLHTSGGLTNPDSHLSSPRENPTSSNVIAIRTGSPGEANQRRVPEHLERIIRRRAYELYEMRGRETGHAEEDWLHAEREILGTVLRHGRTG